MRLFLKRNTKYVILQILSENKRWNVNLPSISFPNNGINRISSDGAVSDERVSSDHGAFLHGANIRQPVDVDAS